MPSEFTDLLNNITGLLGLGSGAAGGGYAWFQSRQNKSDVKELRSSLANNAQDMNARIDANQKTISDFMVVVAREYASKDDIGEIKSMLRRIEDKMDGKQDK